MSSQSAQTAPLAPDTEAHSLAALRAEIDRMDDALHDLLMRRAEVVAQVGALHAKGRVPLRPGREASIVRRLLAGTTAACRRRRSCASGANCWPGPRRNSGRY